MKRRSIKELTIAPYPNPLDVSKQYRFGLPTGEGPPQGLRGSRGRVPLVGSDKVRGVSFPCKAWIGEAKEPRRARGKKFCPNVLGQMVLLPLYS